MSPKRSDRTAARRSTELRPTMGRVSGAIFSMLGPDGPAGMRVLDLFAGSGALGIEALRRGADHCDFVEVNAKRCEAIGRELERLGFTKRSNVIRGNAMTAWNRLGEPYDLLFIDPPYGSDALEPIMNRLGERPSNTTDRAYVFAEHSAKTVMEEQYGDLVRSTARRYGDTGLSVFRRKTAGGDQVG
jgi:16S rRNA (guanine966-N2)-methyltransferase